MKHLFETPAVLYEGNFTVQYIGKVNGEHRLKINGVIYGYEASDTDAGKLQKMLKYSSGRALKWWKSVSTHVSGGSKGTISEALSLNETKINMSMKQFVDFRDKLVEGDLVPDYITFKVTRPFFAGTQESSISELKRVNFIFWNTLQANKKAYLEVPAGEYDIVFNEYNDRIDDFVIGFINAYGNTVNAYAIASKDFEKLPGINITEYGLI